jgi:O-methyltransferase
MINKILNFKNERVDSSIINEEQVYTLVKVLLDGLDSNLDGDVVELGCYVGESSKYLMKTLQQTNSQKKLYVYDSFEGLPDLSKWEENTGWKPRSLKSSEEILINNFEKNNIPLPIIHKNWFKDIPEDSLPDKISFAFLDGDFYDSIYDSLQKIFDRVVDGGYICFHDYGRNDLPGVKAAIEDFFYERRETFEVHELSKQVGVYRKNLPINKTLINDKFMNVKTGGLTLVTGLWDIKRDELKEGWARSFEHYLSKFEQLLKVEENLIIFGEEDLEEFVFEHRSKTNTLFIKKDRSWFKNEFFEKIQNIRQNPE